MRHPMISCLPPLAVLLLVSLAVDGIAAQAVRYDSAGVEVVTSSSPIWADGQGWRISAEPSIRIGTLDGSEPYLLHSVRAVERLDDGRILVANGGTGEVRLYDRTGTFVRSFGGEGDGPGEFRELSGLEVLGDTLTVYDRRNGRLTTFELDGGLGGSVRLADTGDATYRVTDYHLAGAVDDGTFVFVPYAFDAPAMPTPQQFWDSAANLAYRTDGTLLGPFAGASGMDMFGEPGLGTSVRLGAYSVSDAANGRFAISHGHAFEARVYVADGSLRRLVRRDGTPVPVRSDLLEDRLQWMLSNADGDRRKAQVRQRFDEDVTRGRIAESLPTYRAILLEEDGTLWALRYSVPWEDTVQLWDVFDQDGGWLGTVASPTGLEIRDVDSEYVVGVARDEYGVEYVQLHRLAR